MKRFLALVTLICVLATVFTGCKKNKYKPVESTAEESRVVMTLSFGDKTYDVKYELYRTLFLTYKSEYDKGDESVWEGEEKEYYVAQINERIVKEAAEIYSVFSICEAYGIDLYTDEVEKSIYDMITVSVEGGFWGQDYYDGFGGDYGAYLASLKEMYHNYSTAVLLMRYEIGRSKLEALLIGESIYDEGGGRLTNGRLEYDKNRIYDYYYSDNASLVLTTYITEGVTLTTGGVTYDSPEYAEMVRLEIAEEAQNGLEAVRALMINRGTPTAVSELESGSLYGRYSLSREYRTLAEAAYRLGVGDVSEVVPTYTVVDGKRYNIVYKMEKTDSFFTENYAAVVQVYLYDTIGQMIAIRASLLGDSAVYTDAYSEIIHSEVRM